MQLYLFSGFLGSGKTTLVTGLAKHLVEKCDKKVMLIVNDVGDVGIDAQLMRKLQTDVHELFGGCICGQMGNLITLLMGVGDKYIVDAVLLEASGIAQPSRFIDTIEALMPDNSYVKIVTLVDATRWEDLRLVVEDLVKSQVESAHLTLINKADAVDHNTITRVIGDVKTINPQTEIMVISTNKKEHVLKIAEVIESGSKP